MRWLILVSVLLFHTACGSVGTLGDYGDEEARPGVCGNGVQEDDEECDGDDLGGTTCESRGFDGGTMRCDLECLIIDSQCDESTEVPARWSCPEALYASGGSCDCGCGEVDPDCSNQSIDACDTCDAPGSCSDSDCPGDIEPTNNSLCSVISSVCGNDTKEAGEVCDGFDVGPQTCQDEGFGGGGTLQCNSSCDGYDTTLCITDVVPPTWTCNPGFYAGSDGCDCGCGAFDPDCPASTSDVCEFCTSTGSCASSCADIDTVDNSTCGGAGAICPNNVVEGLEVCDGTDLSGNDCTTIGLGFTGGTLACNASCDDWDTSSCTGGGGGGPPSTWVCNSLWWSDGLCDCGCGAFDVDDCASQTDVSECDYCDDVGSCAVTCSDIDPTDISTCGPGGGGTGNTPAAAGDIIVTELMPNPATLSDSAGEWFEIYNPSTTDFDLTDCVFRSDPSNQISADGQTIPAGGYLVYAASTAPGFTPDSTYSQGTFSLRNGDDTWELWCDAGSGDLIIDSVAYDDSAGWTLNAGESMQLDRTVDTHTGNDDPANWCVGTLNYNGDKGSPGAQNEICP